jgi:hypothetical protein
MPVMILSFSWVSAESICPGERPMADRLAAIWRCCFVAAWVE